MAGPVLHDLSHPLRSGMPVYPGDPQVAIAPALTVAVEGVNVLGLHLGSQSGTHVDAPYHVDDALPDLDALPLERFVGPAVLLDARGSDSAPGAACLGARPGGKQARARHRAARGDGLVAALGLTGIPGPPLPRARAGSPHRRPRRAGGGDRRAQRRRRLRPTRRPACPATRCCVGRTPSSPRTSPRSSRCWCPGRRARDRGEPAAAADRARRRRADPRRRHRPGVTPR